MEAWPAILAVIPEARWILCGPRDPWFVKEVEPGLKKFAESIVCTGTLSGVAVFEHLAAADLHINPSLCESLNMVTVEAASVGTPTICSDRAGICHWIRQYDAGTVFESKNIQALTDAIIQAIYSPEMRTRWSISCRELAKEFSVERVAAMLVNCFVTLPNLRSRF